MSTACWDSSVNAKWSSIRKALCSEDNGSCFERMGSLCSSFKLIKAGRMCKDKILLPVRGEGLLPEGEDASEADASRVVYVLHPDCAVEEW